ncbi:MAG TPA: TRAP transporter permease [Beutenbergiaceae bacterium]|nr:TRAP transporter permease [Beutenbergiaceae bacterium]
MTTRNVAAPRASLEVADEQAQEVLREHDAASRFRTDLGWWGWLVGGLSIALTLFHLYTALTGSRPTLIQGSIHVGGAVAIIFLLYPARKKPLGAPTGAVWKDFLLGRGRGVPWYDFVLSVLGLAANLYIVYRYDFLRSPQPGIFGYDTIDYVVAIMGIVLVLEATRRCVGLPIVIVAGTAFLYGVFGNYSPLFRHSGNDFTDYAATTFLETGAIFGTPIQVSSTFIYLFLLFAVVLIQTNIGTYFTDLAFRAAGRYTGGPAKAAVAASGLQGMVSGSSVANTVASGSFTIPMMKKSGFRPHAAAATEATASTGGQLMPPIMGAAAFIMAEYTGVPYSEIIVIAIIPALLYFLGVMISVHFEAKRDGLGGMAKEDLPSAKSLLTRIDLILPLVVIVYMLLSGSSPARSALYAIATAFLLSFLRKSTRLGPRGIVELMIAGARTALPVIAACASAGIVAGTVTNTPLGQRLGRGVIELAGGSLLLILVFTMIACLILGMGLPTTANYVVTATVAAPILVDFGIPLIAAHMFVFFFGILADVTPPVCLAAFAGAGIARANPLRTGVTALRLAVAGFLIPYVFVLQPALVLQAGWQELPVPLLTLIGGMIALAAGMAGHALIPTTVVERALLIIGGVALVYPNVVVSLAGLACVAIALVTQLSRRKRQPSRDGADPNTGEPAGSDVQAESTDPGTATAPAASGAAAEHGSVGAAPTLGEARASETATDAGEAVARGATDGGDSTRQDAPEREHPD